MIKYYGLYKKAGDENYLSIYSTDSEYELFRELRQHKNFGELMVVTPVRVVTGNCLIEYLKLMEKLFRWLNGRKNGNNIFELFV